MLIEPHAIETYIHAKDENRPHLMRRAFSESAVLEMHVKTGTISFPPRSHGVGEITRVLVRDFGQAYENVYTFCLARKPRDTGANFRCRWLVGMSEKASGNVRVGCGRYDWAFQTEPPGLVEKLTITIDIMEMLSPDHLDPVMAWLSELPYPWCEARTALKTGPKSLALEAIFEYLRACGAD